MLDYDILEAAWEGFDAGFGGICGEEGLSVLKIFDGFGFDGFHTFCGEFFLERGKDLLHFFRGHFWFGA